MSRPRFEVTFGPGWIVDGDRAWFLPPAIEPRESVPLGPEWVDVGYVIDETSA